LIYEIDCVKYFEVFFTLAQSISEFTLFGKINKCEM